MSNVRNNKLSELISSLSYNEQQLFGRYLASPFFNADSKTVLLFEILNKAGSTGSFPDKAGVFKKLYGKEKFNDKKLRYRFSYLVKHLEDFLAIRQFQKDEKSYLINLQKSLSNRNTSKTYSAVRLKSGSGKRHESVGILLHDYLSAEQHHSYSAMRLSRITQLNYDSMIDNLDQFYFLRKLQLYCELINLKNVLQSEPNVLLIEEICSLISKNNFYNSKAIEIYYFIMLTLTEPQHEAHFNTLLDLVESNREIFPASDLKDIFQYVRNYCIKMINTGKDAYRQKLFGIYKSILSDTRLMQLGYLSQWEFKNIVTLGLRLKQDKWVQRFIRNYAGYVAPDERKNALTYNKAVLCYHEKNYRQTLKLIREVEFSDLYYALDSKSLLMKVYYETDDMETFLYHISAFKIFLRRNKFISEYQREIYRNFIRFTLKLFRSGYSRTKLTVLREQLANESNISDRSWLLEKADDLAGVITSS